MMFTLFGSTRNSSQGTRFLYNRVLIFKVCEDVLECHYSVSSNDGKMTLGHLCLVDLNSKCSDVGNSLVEIVVNVNTMDDEAFFSGRS